ncbi:hypothetical protein Hanom_Chr08g00698111 [Helianthus anomalus]
MTDLGIIFLLLTFLTLKNPKHNHNSRIHQFLSDLSGWWLTRVLRWWQKGFDLNFE